LSPLELVLSRLTQHRLKQHGSRWRSCCPAHGGDNPTALSITEGDAGCVLLTCFRGCAFDEIAEALGLDRRDLFPDAGQPAQLGPMPLPPQRRVNDARHVTLSDAGRALWASCRSVDGLAKGYLLARDCAIPPAAGDLRWHPSLQHPSGHSGPGLVALVTHAVTREPLTLHRTWIRGDGTKADVQPARMLLGGHRKSGGVIRLWPDEWVTTGLGIAEGIESALSLAHAHEPVWSCIDAGNLATLPALLGIESLVIAVDHDPAGITASEACAERWTAAGKSVHLIMAQQPGHDLNDLAQEAA
jgi:putative DNA primase/helicase